MRLGDRLTDPFNSLFGTQRSTNPNRRRDHVIESRGLTVVMVKGETGFRSGPARLGETVKLRTQFAGEGKARKSAEKQLRRRGERPYDWEVVRFELEPLLADPVAAGV